MRTKKYLLVFFTFCLVHFSPSVGAQNFLWGRSGGGSNPTQGVDDETIKDIATDKNGNVYILSQVIGGSTNVAGQPVTVYGGNDIMLASFKPDGTLRWVKMIGNGRVDDAFALATDGNDGVYFCGAMDNSNGAGHIDVDATLPQNYQHQILIKYDTDGNFKWYRQPEDASLPSATSWSYTGTIAMDVDNAGNTYWLMQLYPGTYNGSLTVSTTGIYILKYDASGGFTYVKPAINGDIESLYNSYLTIDNSQGKLYLSGWRALGGTLSIGGNSITHPMYIASLNLDGSFNWKRENSRAMGGFYYRPIVDLDGNIYIAGSAYGAFSGTPPYPPDTFNGYVVTHGGGSSTPFLVKIDKNGNNIWAADAEVNAASGASAIGLRNNEVIITGDFPGLLQWPGYGGAPYNKPPNDGYDVFITRFDAGNGTVLGMDKINSSSGVSEFPTCMASDGNGNVYIGGEFASDMSVGLNNLATTGGQTDWFLVKYGNMWPDNVNALISEQTVLCYPNPAVNTLYIDKAGAGTTMQLTDMTGRNLATQILQSEHERIDVSPYPSSSYIIQLTDKNGGRITKKIIKG